VCYHRVGTPRRRDNIAFSLSSSSVEDKEKSEWIYGADASEDAKYIYLYLQGKAPIFLA
jgi:hypothetical protein